MVVCYVHPYTPAGVVRNLGHCGECNISRRLEYSWQLILELMIAHPRCELCLVAKDVYGTNGRAKNRNAKVLFQEVDVVFSLQDLVL